MTPWSSIVEFAGNLNYFKSLIVSSSFELLSTDLSIMFKPPECVVRFNSTVN